MIRARLGLYLETEEHTSNRRPERDRDARGSCSRQNFPLPCCYSQRP